MRKVLQQAPGAAVLASALLAALPAVGQMGADPTVVFFQGPVGDCRPAPAGEAAGEAPTRAPARAGALHVITGAPYSAVGKRRTVTTLADGNRIVRESTTRYYRDSRGRTRTEHVLSGVGPFALEEPRTIVMINDPVAGENYVLHPEARRADVLPAPTRTAEPPAGDVIVGGPGLLAVPGTPLPCAPFSRKLPDPVSLGERTIAGLRVLGTRHEFQIPPGEMGNEQPIAIRSEQWFSPELGVVVSSTHSDPMLGETSYALEQIARLEPEAALFAVPEDYSRRTLPRPQAAFAPIATRPLGGKPLGAAPVRSESRP